MAGTLQRMRCQSGDLALLSGPRRKEYLVRLTPGEELTTHYGNLSHDDLIGISWGSQIPSHTGSRFLVLQPNLAALLKHLERTTQIVYPKDIGLILAKIGIGPGWRVAEAGTGSGGMTSALAHVVAPEGNVYSYEIIKNRQELAKANMEAYGLLGPVKFRHQDIAKGFNEEMLDAVFLDLPTPEAYLPQTVAALKPGGHLACLLPTMNQVSRLLTGMESHPFATVEVCESLIRSYKPFPDRLRPMDRMVAHTGYLIFARRVLPIGAEVSYEPR